MWRGLLLKSVLILLFTSLLTPVLPSVHAQELQRYEFSSPQMGSQFRIVLYAVNDSLAHEASHAAFDRVHELNDVLSDYLTESELSRLSRSSGSGVFIPVSDDLFQVLEKSVDISRLSGGAFDVTAGPYTQLWREIRQHSDAGLPADEKMARARIAVDYRLITLERENRSVRLEKSDMRLDLGGIAKGYAGDEVLNVLNAFGISSAMVDAGGDLVLGDAPPGETGWRIVIPFSPNSPQTENSAGDDFAMMLSNCAVATSGDLYQYVEIDGRRYSHIIDPATGLGLTARRRVTVVAPDGITADGLSSAISVLGPGRGVRLLERLPDSEGMIFHETDGKINSTYSSGFQRLPGVGRTH